MAGAGEKTGRSYLRPRDALRDVIEAHGYRIRRRPLVGPRTWGLTDPEAKTVWVCLNLDCKMKHPGKWEEAAAFTLAHELAHIRIHLRMIAEGTHGHLEEVEANRYAGVFLVPQAQLHGLPLFVDMCACRYLASPQLWEYVDGLAEYFGVSSAAMAAELHAMKVLRLDRATRELSFAA